MSWVKAYSEQAGTSDRLADDPNHLALLAVGVLGETGSLVSELKKEHRDREAYPGYRKRLEEEIGDLLWYFTRLAEVAGHPVEGSRSVLPATRKSDAVQLTAALELGGVAGKLMSAVGGKSESLGAVIDEFWRAFCELCLATDVDLRAAAEKNILKTKSRWPGARVHARLFDEKFDVSEQLPRELEIEFREIKQKKKVWVLLRCNNLNFGDRITDNIKGGDFYRFHDVFHFAYAAHLGWSPVLRSLLRCKRKSKPEFDEDQDGARALIIEEAVSAAVFSRAKELRFYDGINYVDYDLLKQIKELVRGYEVEEVPLWQWEDAILDSYRIFRALRDNHGGILRLNMLTRSLEYRSA